MLIARRQGPARDIEDFYLAICAAHLHPHAEAVVLQSPADGLPDATDEGVIFDGGYANRLINRCRPIHANHPITLPIPPPGRRIPAGAQ